MTEENNPTQEKKSEERQTHPTINIEEYTQEMKTEQIHAQRLPMEPETTPILNNEIPWMDYDWARNDSGANYYSWGMPMTMPMYWGNTPETQNKGNQKGGHVPEWSNKGQDPVGGSVHKK